ncbi:MAG: hypothetical protein C0478_03795 [Planctomyces sp.]|nr:hypothetical protein [Planctomyces sp.]
MDRSVSAWGFTGPLDLVPLLEHQIMSACGGQPRWVEQTASAARFLTSFWLGAAALFVAAGIREVTTPGLDDAVKDVLVERRFFVFYLFQWICLSAALACAAVLAVKRRWGRDVVIVSLLGVATALAVYDYFQIYLPLLELLNPPGQPRSDAFEALHQFSEYVNSVGWVLVFVAACLLHACPQAFGCGVKVSPPLVQLDAPRAK